MTDYLPNAHHHLKVVEVSIEGDGRYAKAEQRSFDIIGWHVEESGRVLPLTVTGVVRPKDGGKVVILNTTTKEVTTSDGEHFHDWATFVGPLYREHEAKAAETEPTRRLGGGQVIG